MAEDSIAKQVSDAPWWIRLVYMIGVPSTIALFLVWILAGTTTTSLREISSTLNNMRENLVLHSADTAYTAKRIDRIEQLLQQICVNTASNSSTRAACFK